MPDQVRWSLFIYLALASIAWIYIWLRAYHLDFLSDEAATFFMYVQPGELFPPFSVTGANNHILNSILTWMSCKAFGSSPIALRLPNILSALVYFFFIYKLSGFLNGKVLKWGFIILSLYTHFILEFFSYSRGYGLSMAFFAGSVYTMILLSRELKLKHLIMGVLWTFLAVAANLNMIIISLAIYSFMVYILLLTDSADRKTRLAGLVFLIIAGGSTSAYFIFNSLQIKNIDGFYYGSSGGFFKVTVDTLAGMISGSSKIILNTYSISIFIHVLVASIIILFIKRLRHHLNNPGTIFIILIYISWISSLILNKLWKVNYQEDRAAMHYIPLFYGMVFFSLDNLKPSFRRYSLIAILPLALILFYSARQFSLDKTAYGNSQMVPGEYFRFIKNDAQGEAFPPVVSSYQARRQVWAFMNYRDGGSLNPLMGTAFPNTGADYLISGFPIQDSLKTSFEAVLDDESTSTGLYRNTSLPMVLSCDTLFQSEPFSGRNEFYDLFKIQADSLQGMDARLETMLKIESPAIPLQAAVVVEVFDANRKTIAYEAIDIDQLQPAWNGAQTSFRHVLLIHDIPAGSRTILMYFWNKKKVPVIISEGNLTLKIMREIKEK